MFVPDVHKGIRDLLVWIKEKKVKQFVLSASEKTLLKESVIYYGLSPLFEEIYGVDNLNAVGKDRLARLLCTQHRLDYKETLFIGDTEYDANMALDLGCPVVLVSHGHINYGRLLKTKQTVLRSVEDLERFLKSNL